MPWAYSTSEDTPRFHEKGNGGVRSRGFSFLPKSVTAFKKPTWETRANLRKETDMETWECVRPAPGRLTPSPEGRWPAAIPSGLDRSIEESARAGLARFPDGTWGAFIEFDAVRFETDDLLSGAAALAALHAKVAACPYFTKLARPGLTHEMQDRFGKRARGTWLVLPQRGCDQCSIRNTVRLCQ